MGNLLCGRAEPESELGPSGGQGEFVCMASIEQHCVVVARRLSPLDAHILSHMSSFWNFAVRRKFPRNLVACCHAAGSIAWHHPCGVRCMVCISYFCTFPRHLSVHEHPTITWSSSITVPTCADLVDSFVPFHEHIAS